MRWAAAISTEPVARTFAERALSDGGTALDATIAGFFAAAAERPSVLLSPLQILVAGPGVGARAFDGRVRQPGSGAPRPRGFLRGKPIPKAAHAGVPASLLALAVAHAHDNNLSFSRLSQPAVDIARHRGSDERASALARVSTHGAAALRDNFFARPLIAAAGRVAGGLLTQEDLALVRPGSESPREIVSEESSRRVLVAPWEGLLGTTGRYSEIIAAGDHRGVLAVLAYTPDDEGVEVPELGLALTRDAVPVLRGIPRTSPGTPSPSPKPLGIILEGALPLIALGAKSKETPNDGSWLSTMEIAAILPMLEELKEKASASLAIGVVSAKGQKEMASFSA